MLSEYLHYKNDFYVNAFCIISQKLSQKRTRVYFVFRSRLKLPAGNLSLKKFYKQNPANV